jgi:DNA-binding MarR family transcriptional regulator
MHHPETLEKAMGLYLRSAGMIDPFRMRTWKGLELTVTQLRVLLVLREDPGAPAGVLAERLRVTPPTVTGLVDRLVRSGAVQREEDPKDRRLVRNVLTERGQEVLGEVEREGRTFLTQVFERLSKEQLSGLVESLEALVAAGEGLPALEEAEQPAAVAERRDSTRTS